MKNKILIFLIGILVGAIIAMVGFYAYSKSHMKKGFKQGDRPEISDQSRETAPEMPSGEQGGGTKPDDMPSNKSDNETSSDTISEETDS